MAFVLLTAFQTFVVAAQASIVGTVRDDETNQPLVGAVVAVTDLNRVAVTDTAGRYVLTDVPPGQHHIAVRLIGYSDRQLQAIVPPEGTLEINISLHSEPVALPGIEVLAKHEDPRQTGSAYPDQVSFMSSAWTNPLLSEPDALMALSGSEVASRPEAPNGLNIRGGASDQTAYLLDGIPVFSPYHAAGVFSAWNPDALSELTLNSAGQGAEYGDGLSGVVSAATRDAGPRTSTRGGVSTTQARLTIDGPIGRSGAGYMISARSGVPGPLGSEGEASYLRGGTSDWLAKAAFPALGGRLRFLFYDSENRFNSAPGAEGEVVTAGPGRNRFTWRSRSAGAEWNGVLGSRTGLRIRAWSANADAGSDWSALSDPLELSSTRRDLGLLAMVERASPRGSTSLGVRLERSSTAYRIESDSAPGMRLSALTPVATVFAERRQEIGTKVGVDVGASVAVLGHSAYLSPSLQLRWHPDATWSMTGSVARRHQFAQSLRNPESIVGSVFPVDLFLGSGAPGVPVAESDQALVAMEYRPLPSLRFGVQAYQRWSENILLVAPGESEPFATGALGVGSANARGVSLDAGLTAGAVALTASYGFQRVRLSGTGASYTPEYGAGQILEGGIAVSPTSSSSVRLGVTSMFGRKTTPVSSGLEWESCNLLDRGCEFGGSPHYSGQSLGSRTLPAYFRLDLGLRKEWRFTLGGMAAQVALFGTLTNLFNRKNVLTYANDPTTGKPMGIEMRPLAPLVFGLDWRF